MNGRVRRGGSVRHMNGLRSGNENSGRERRLGGVRVSSNRIRKERLNSCDFVSIDLDVRSLLSLLRTCAARLSSCQEV